MEDHGHNVLVMERVFGGRLRRNDYTDGDGRRSSPKTPRVLTGQGSAHTRRKVFRREGSVRTTTLRLQAREVPRRQGGDLACQRPPHEAVHCGAEPHQHRLRGQRGGPRLRCQAAVWRGEGWQPGPADRQGGDPLRAMSRAGGMGIMSPLGGSLLGAGFPEIPHTDMTQRECPHCPEGGGAGWACRNTLLGPWGSNRPLVLRSAQDIAAGGRRRAGEFFEGCQMMPMATSGTQCRRCGTAGTGHEIGAEGQSPPKRHTTETYRTGGGEEISGRLGDSQGI